MSRIYSSTNRIKFTDIPEKYAIPRGFRAKQSEVHSAVVSYVYEHYKDTKKYRQQVVDALNRLTYCIMNDELPSFNWISTDPINTMPDMDIDIVEDAIGDFYLTPESIQWDVSPNFQESAVEGAVSEKKSDDNPVTKLSTAVKTNTQPKVVNKPLQQVAQSRKAAKQNNLILTPKEDLYIQPPKYPRFDISKIWMTVNIGNDSLVIYTTLPEIPTKQNEVSVTTDLKKMTDTELMNLYPNHVIHTRSQQLYNQYNDIDYDNDLGCIFPIEGFTKDQIVDNIIKYPHLYRLRKMSEEGKLQPFFKTIEIDGCLHPIGDVWETLPESKIIPHDPEFIKEYVIRRYLLERDNGVVHKYKMFGMLDPFLTLFMPPDQYAKRGYNDTTSIAKQCVTSRIHYKQSRSPILRRLENA